MMTTLEQIPRPRRRNHVPPSMRQSGAASDGYILLATEVVRQCYEDALLPGQCKDVLACIASGRISWWLAQAGIEDGPAERACAAIRARARRW